MQQSNIQSFFGNPKAHNNISIQELQSRKEANEDEISDLKDQEKLEYKDKDVSSSRKEGSMQDLCTGSQIFK